MSLDIRSQMAVNLCFNLDCNAPEKFRNLAVICHAWGFGEKESFPLACALKDKLGLSNFSAINVMGQVVDKQELSNQLN